MADDQQNTGGNTSDGAWRTELPTELRSHEAFAPYKTKSELWEGVTKLHTDYKATAQKAADLETKYANAIPKLPANATEEERNLYFQELGRPEKPEAYELPGDDNAPEWTNYWKQEFYKLGVSNDTAKSLSSAFNTQMQKLVENYNAGIAKQIEESSVKLKTELGDKYDASIDLAKRLWKTHADTEFDEAFKAETSANRYSMVKFLLKIAKLTGEDISPQGDSARDKGKAGGSGGQWFPNSPASPTGK